MAKNKGKLVFGIGINDADYSVSGYEFINGKNKQVWMCPVYRTWRDMLGRCHSAYQIKGHTYIGCSIDPIWHSFMVFREWMLSKDWSGMAIDKDIINPGNKIYGPESCVFVSQSLNNFLTDSARSRGDYPIGVTWNVVKEKFHARCNHPFEARKESLGYFDCPNMAYQAWRQRKHQHACRYADMQTDLRIAEALRNRYALFSEPK